MSKCGENIRKRKDGRWEGRYYILESEMRKSITHSVYAKTYGEVKEKLSVARRSVSSVMETTGELLFCVMTEEWLWIMEEFRKYTIY